MRFTAIALASTATAATLVERSPADASKIVSVVGSVASSVNTLDSSIKSYSGGAITAQLNLANSLVNTIKSGQSSISSISDGTLTVTDSVSIATALDPLNAAAKSLESDLLAKRPQIEAIGQCSEVRNAVGQVVDNGNSLVSNVLKKLGNDVQGVGAELAAPLQSVLAKASDDFTTSNCVDKAGSSSGSSSASSAPAASSTAASSAVSAASSASVASSGAETATGSAPTGVYTPPSTLPTGGSAPETTPSSAPSTVPTAAASLVAPAGALAAFIAAVFAL